MVVIRLSRTGAKKRPFYHICVTDRRKRRDSNHIEKLGFFNPIAKKGEEKIRLDVERFDYWTSVGAIPSDTVMTLYKRSKLSEEDVETIEEKKLAQKQRRKERDVLKKQEEAEKTAEEAPAEEAPAEEAPAEEAPAEEAPAEEAPAEEAPAEEAPAEEAPAEEAAEEEAPAEEAPAEEAPAEEAAEEEAPAEEAPAEEAPAEEAPAEENPSEKKD